MRKARGLRFGRVGAFVVRVVLPDTGTRGGEQFDCSSGVPVARYFATTDSVRAELGRLAIRLTNPVAFSRHDQYSPFALRPPPPPNRKLYPPPPPPVPNSRRVCQPCRSRGDSLNDLKSKRSGQPSPAPRVHCTCDWRSILCSDLYWLAIDVESRYNI